MPYDLNGKHLDVKEAAEDRGVSPQLIRAACKSGKLKATPINGERQASAWLIKPEDLLEWDRNRRPRGRPKQTESPPAD